MKTSKLSIRLLWYITPLVILPLLFLGGFTLTNVTNSTQKQADLIMSRFVEQQQQKVFNYIDSFHSTAKLLSTSPVLNDFLSNDIHADGSYTRRLGALMDVFASYSEAYPDIISINLVSASGKSDAYYSNNLTTAPQSYPFFKQVLQSNLRQQQFMVQNNDGTTNLFFVQRVQSVDYYLKRPQQLGFIVLQVEPSILNTSILEAPYNNTLNLLLTNDGQILFSSDYSLRGQYITEHELEQVHDLADVGTLSTIELSSIDKIERMIFAVQMSGGYYFVSTIPKGVLYQSGKAISLITGLIVIISVITLPILIFVVVRNLLLNPIELLGAASHRVGDGDLSVNLPAHTNDEVGVLFNDFNHMINQIRHYQEQLEEYKHHLEDKVESRTKALEAMNSQLELAIAQAEQANQLKSRFLANMSHEIRTPLTAIMGFTEQLLINDKVVNDKQHLNTILRNSKHLLELINNILDLSKIEAEKLAVEQAPLNVVQLVHDIESIIEPLAHDKQLAFSIHYELPLPRTIYSDMTRLKQILINIASNAVKFTEQGNVSICVHYLQSKQQLEFVVKDTGIGMSEHQIERIFKPFEQADATTTRRFGGTGLGLCISKNLAQLLGGDVTLKSEIGIGSRFAITVDCHINEPKQPLELLTEQAQLIPEKDPFLSFATSSFDANILVAEDNPDNQLLIKLLLQTWGLEPDMANNGAQAVEMALVNDYQLIIMGFTEQLLINDKVVNDKQHLNTILRNSKHLLELINNILDLSKIEAEKLAVEQAPLNVVQLVHDIESIIEPLAHDKQLAFSIHYELPLPRTIYSDMTRLKQILINIASNAVKFTEQGNVSICVHYLQSKQQLEFVVKDTGIGMSEHQIERIFKPFEQADATTTRRFGGTGLGLCISKNLAQLLGGDVTLKSEIGIGSRFAITVDCHINEPKQPLELLTEQAQLIPEKDPFLSFATSSFDANILVAEDNPDNQLLIKLLLQTWGLEPDMANNGAQAVEMALVNDYQLIIMDMQMPVMGGLEATKMLRHAAYDGPIIALTANVMNHDIDTYIEAGCDKALAKPIDKDALENVLVSYLNLEKDNQNKWDSLLKSEKFQQINDNYVANLPSYLQKVNSLKASNDAEALRSVAHSLKGSAGCFNFDDIYHSAALLEENLLSNDQAQRPTLIVNLINAIEQTIARSKETA